MPAHGSEGGRGNRAGALASAIAALLAATTAVAAASDRVALGRSIAQDLTARLKARLMAGLEGGGPESAIAICKIEAPALAAAASAQHGARVGRTSLRVRNPANRPDAWERGVLEDFERRRARGEAVEALEAHASLAEDGRRVSRYMKAIPTGELCLACHGETLAPAVTAKLDALYPEDRARGFRAGDIRGAVTITWPE